MGFFRTASQEEHSSAGLEKPPSTYATGVNGASHNAPLLQLPPEIIQQILSYLTCQSLVSLSRACRRLRGQAENDLLWQRLLRLHIPAQDFPETPYPSNTYRELYISHHPYWFLPQYKLWFSDEPHTGRIMLVKFDARRGCIEGYRLLADRGNLTPMIWQHEPSVMIHSFSPRVHLWLDDPVLKLNHEPAAFNTRQGWWEGEIKMKVGRDGHNTSASFSLARNIPQALQDRSMELWPPTTIPDMPRVRAVSQDKFRGKGHKPQKYEEISHTSFRLRQWSQFSIETAFFGVRMGEEVSTWSTIDPVLYTPTKQKPYQGIFVGDYAGHGCEFLLVTQTDKAPDPPDHAFSISSIYYERMSVAALNAIAEMRTARPPATAVIEEEGLQGALEAIKISGDINIPRGEHTWIADDIGSNGLIRIANEAPFQGARIVKSRGHIAGRGFVHDEFVPSQLIMKSNNELAQYWVGFGHISWYKRIDIDQILRQSPRSKDGGWA